MSIFVIPMAGLSSRFFKAGYEVPKYQLPVNQQTMFDWSVSSFKKYFSTDKFLFIVRDVYDTPEFVKIQCEKLGIREFHIHILERETLGQAETVFLGLSNYSSHLDSSEDIIIFNIDSKRINYSKPDWLNSVDGYLELFEGEGDHWSFAQLDDSNNVIRTTEKQRISEYCSDGLYHFKNLATYRETYQDTLVNQKLEKDELYIAPLYNYLVEKGCIIKGDVICNNLISFAGTPDEYLQILGEMNDFN
ncbi:glycosyltransferase family 2 protein [Moraxella boevrei]|uniref:glycosyltransferase family 2 protein n=1 Tax=Faucicola boevrei TaxID=346665 RepID=UPI003735FCEB